MAVDYRKRAEERFKHHLKDGRTWIGIYENKSLDSKNIGHRVGMFFDIDQWDKAKIGDRAPDVDGFLGWKYTLVHKARTAEDALNHMNFGK